MQEEHFEKICTTNSQMLNKAEIGQLANLIFDHCPNGGTFSQNIPGLYFRRYSKTSTDWEKSFYL